MMTQLRRLLAPPVFEGDEDKTHAADLLHTILLTLLFGVLIYSITAPIVAAVVIRRLTIVGPLLLVLLGMLFLTRRGHVRAASIVTIASIWALLLYVSILGGGVRAAAFGGFVIVVFTTGILLGQRAAIGLAVLSGLAGLAMVYAARAGVLPTPLATASDMSLWIAHAVYMVVAAVLLSRALRATNQAMKNAHLELDERRQAEAALRASEERYRVISDLISDYAYAMRIEPDGRSALEWVTDAVVRITGYTPEEVRTSFELETVAHQEDLPIVAERRRRLRLGEPNISEVRIRAKGGQAIWLRFYDRPVWDAAQQRVVRVYGAVQDITKVKQLEQQLTQAQKMKAVGRLAGGVAHDFNNILTIILTSCSFILEDLDQGHPLCHDVEQIQSAAERAAELTQQLLAFSRQQVLLPDILDLNEVVTNIEKLLRPLIGEDIDLAIELDPGLGQVQADRGQIEQVLMNLVVNARDAMPDGGKLLIETATVYLDEAYAHEHVNVRAGQYIMLAISDTGHGMDAATRARIFDPFFTTKAKGKGTGLGLATVHGIVSQSGGHIWVYSEPGHGTSFKIYLPQADAAPSEPRPSQILERLELGAGTILLVEDERAVRELAGRTLRRQGYRLLEADDGSMALRIAAGHAEQIHLLLTDVVMPGGISGRQLAEQLIVERPAMKILYMSGYTDDAIMHHGVLAANMAFIQKPFTPDALLRKVQEVLGT